MSKNRDKKKERKGPRGFERYFASEYGGRWPDLKEALKGETQSLALEQGLEKSYYLDPASLETARLLGAEPGDEVLDMCAAPGGKTLVLALMLQGQGLLVSNDRSAGRRARLRRVIEEHLSPELRAPIQVSSHDATRWGLHEQERYDRILLDAPCSSERHLLSDPKYLEQWSPGRTKRLASQAFAMAAAAIDALKPGGRLLYSTCSISALENQELIEKLLKRRRSSIRPIPLPEDRGEPCGAGRIILPDRAAGQGPMFAALLEKCDSESREEH